MGTSPRRASHSASRRKRRFEVCMSLVRSRAMRESRQRRKTIAVRASFSFLRLIPPPMREINYILSQCFPARLQSPGEWNFLSILALRHQHARSGGAQRCTVSAAVTIALLDSCAESGSEYSIAKRFLSKLCYAIKRFVLLCRTDPASKNLSLLAAAHRKSGAFRSKLNVSSYAVKQQF